MASIGFGVCLVLSILIIIYMASKNYDYINVYYWTIVILIPIIILGYWLKTRVTTPEAALMSFCFIYIDSTVMLILVIFSMLYSLGIELKAWIKCIVYAISFCHLGMIWLCFDNKLYYSSIEIIQSGAGSITKMTAGPLKIVHTVYLSLVILAILAIVITAFLRKGTYSRRTLFYYAFLSSLSLFVYAIEVLIDINFSLLPYLYVLGDFIIAINYDHEHMHDISCIISQQQKYFGNKGYIAVDLNQKFLSCNEKTFDYIPSLKKQRVDELITTGIETFMFREMIVELEDEGKSSRKFKVGEMTCVCEVNRFSLRRDGKVQGYLFDLRDATEEQKILDVMTSYNDTLNDEIAAKTADIRNIQNKIVLGMANIIENRDNNTGGHVKRTSDVIILILEELNKNKDISMDSQLAYDIVRAAPMHDLGKVSIDSTILCKPGKLTPEEYEIMKTHSAMSGEMVHILLDGVEEEHFVQTAYNVARFHHERWDGRGYPEGLVGSMIPIEARIMAIADVYDALVSKRCYKKAYSFEEAKQIMCDGMGTQFDPNLKKVFLGCVDKLEDYYKTNSEQ